MSMSPSVKVPSAYAEGIAAFLKGEGYREVPSNYRVGSFEWAVWGVGWSTAEGWNLAPEDKVKMLSQIKD